PRVQLFFPGADDVLHLEESRLPRTDDPEEAATLIASAVLAGPESARLRPPLPPGIEVGSLDFSADGTVYVDLVSETFATPPASGTRVELLSLYSLVNSIVHNVEGAKSVVILWNGRQPVTFGGHIDTSHPVRPDMGLVARDARLLP
ncbi:MAG: GerMN domain-containing protein, partial [Acidobacteria bacterium]|nr:GerMN domain-containing protein [Acidobacteriota bacterium]